MTANTGGKRTVKRRKICRTADSFLMDLIKEIRYSPKPAQTMSGMVMSIDFGK